MDAAYTELTRRLSEIHDLEKARELLYWDQVVMMPAGGASVRGDARATLARHAHDLSVDNELGRLLDRLEPLAESLPYDSDEASLIRMAGDRLMAIAFRILRDADRAEDAVQQAIVTAWR